MPHRLACFVVVAVMVDGFAAPATQRTGSPDPYTVATLCVAAPAKAGPVLPVSTGDEFQAALDRATAGTTIVLTAGSTYRPAAGTPFVLRNRSLRAGEWITIRSSSPAFDPGGATPPGARATPAAGQQFAAIRATTARVPAIRTDPGARGYRLIGLDIGADDGITQVDVIELGDGTDTTTATEPSDIVVDRCLVHGNDAGSYRRGIALNGARLAVVDSDFRNFHDAGTDSQAIAGWNGPGPFAIVNNYLEAASENILFGGGDPAVPSLVPSDITIRRNISTKPLLWRTSGIPVKNAFELKSARRVVVEGNTFENVWPSGQDGTAILLKSTNQDGGCTWCVTEYVTFADNIVRSASHGLLINAAEVGRKGASLPRRANHFRIKNVLFDGIGAAPFGGGKLFRIFGGVDEIEITHVTSTSNPMGILDPHDANDTNTHLTFTSNIVERKLYGIGAGSAEGIPTLTGNFAPFVYNQNVLVNTSASTAQAIGDSALKSRYPPVTFVAGGWSAVGFAAGTHTLTSASPYYRAGTDGASLGADTDAIAAAQAGPLTTACDANVAIPRSR